MRVVFSWVDLASNVSASGGSAVCAYFYRISAPVFVLFLRNIHLFLHGEIPAFLNRDLRAFCEAAGKPATAWIHRAAGDGALRPNMLEITFGQPVYQPKRKSTRIKGSALRTTRNKGVVRLLGHGAKVEGAILSPVLEGAVS
jgi:hypothetical protein